VEFGSNHAELHEEVKAVVDVSGLRLMRNQYIKK
jgi:hypothetical protein